MCGLSSATDPVQLGPSTLRSICPIGALKCDNWKNGYIDLSQPHVDRLHSNFTRWYSVASGKLLSCKNSLRFESVMADDAQIFNIQIPISLERLKLETSNLVCASTTRSNFDGMQKLSQSGNNLGHIALLLNFGISSCFRNEYSY